MGGPGSGPRPGQKAGTPPGWKPGNPIKLWTKYPRDLLKTQKSSPKFKLKVTVVKLRRSLRKVTGTVYRK